MSTATDDLNTFAAEPLQFVNLAGRAATYLAWGAVLVGATFIGSTYAGGGSSDWQIAGRVALFAGAAILAVLAVIFGALGMWRTPKESATVGLVLGIIVFLAVPGFVVGRVASDNSRGGYSSYSECMRDPETTFSTCQSLFPD